MIPDGIKGRPLFCIHHARRAKKGILRQEYALNTCGCLCAVYHIFLLLFMSGFAVPSSPFTHAHLQPRMYCLGE
jgi:hypothetical protein